MANPDLLTGLGAAFSIFLCSVGSVVASIQGGLYALRSNGGSCLSFVPIIIAGVLSIYGIIIAIILCGQTDISEADGYKNLCAGLSVGLACLMSGIGMSSFLDKHMKPPSPTPAAPSTRRGEQEEPLLSESYSPYEMLVAPPSKSLIMVMIFLEAIGLYGLIVALILSSHKKQ